MTIMSSRFSCYVVPFNFYEVLADYWQAMTLADAAAKCWYKLPIVHQLEAGYPFRDAGVVVSGQKKRSKFLLVD